MLADILSNNNDVANAALTGGSSIIETNFLTYLTGAQTSKLYFGRENGGNPILWRTLQSNSTSVFLFADNVLTSKGGVKFNNTEIYAYQNPASMMYTYSDLRAVVNGLYDDANYFTSGEKQAILGQQLDTYKYYFALSSTHPNFEGSGPYTGDVGGSDAQKNPYTTTGSESAKSYVDAVVKTYNGTSYECYKEKHTDRDGNPVVDYLFPLDWQDMCTAEYGFRDTGFVWGKRLGAQTDGETGIFINNNAKADQEYWLRTAGRDSNWEARATYVKGNGNVVHYNATASKTHYIRPAFYLDYSKILLLQQYSTANAGLTAGSFSAVQAKTSDTTFVPLIADTSGTYDNFAVSKIEGKGNVVEVTFTGAAARKS